MFFPLIRNIKTAGFTGGLVLLFAVLHYLWCAPAYAAWPVDFIADGDTEEISLSGFHPGSTAIDMPRLLHEGETFISFHQSWDFDLNVRESGETINLVEFDDMSFTLHMVTDDGNWGFFADVGKPGVDAMFVSDGLTDGFKVGPGQMSFGLAGRLSGNWAGGLLYHNVNGDGSADIDSLVDNIGRFDPEDTAGGFKYADSGIEFQLRRDGVNGEASSLRVGHREMSAAVDIRSATDSLNIPLPMEGWHASAGYAKNKESSCFVAEFSLENLQDIGRIVFNDELDLGPTHNSYHLVKAGCLWTEGREDGNANYYGFSLGRNRLSSFGSADAVVFGSPIFGILSGRGHYDGTIKIDTLALHYGRRWNIGGRNGILAGLQVVPYRLDAELTTYESAFFGTKIIDEKTSTPDLRGGILGSIGAGFVWYPVDDFKLSVGICQLFPIYTQVTRTEQAGPSPPGEPTSERGGTLISINATYIF